MKETSKDKAKEEDEKREAAIASTLHLQLSIFNSTGLAQQRLAKLQELHRKRLQIKSRSEKHKKSKACTVKETDSNTKCDDAGAPDLKDNSINCTSSREPSDDKAIHHTHKKRQKLFWGLDTKERWERKANM